MQSYCQVAGSISFAFPRGNDVIVLCLQELGQVKTHEIVEARRDKGKKGGTLDMQPSAGRAAGDNARHNHELLHTIHHS